MTYSGDWIKNKVLTDWIGDQDSKDAIWALGFFSGGANGRDLIS